MKYATRFPLVVTGSLVILALTVVAVRSAVPATPPMPPTPSSMAASPVVLTTVESKAVTVFDAQIKEYLAMHTKLESTLPKLSKKSTPAECDKNQRDLSALIRAARPNAKQGDFFTPDMHKLAMRAVAEALSGPGGRASKDSITDDNPILAGLRVNANYPAALPLSTMPLLVLTTLPKLDESLEYRFAGDRLILMDTHANLVIDYTGNVLKQ